MLKSNYIDTTIKSQQWCQKMQSLITSKLLFLLIKLANQGPTEHSLFQEHVPGRFLYFWWVQCSLIQRRNREGIREPLFFPIIFFNFGHFRCCVVAIYKFSLKYFYSFIFTQAKNVVSRKKII